MDDLNNSSWIDRFIFIQPLGGGGMGEVYLAEDRSKNNMTCVIKKVITEGKDLHSQIEMIKICQREADLLRRLNHRGIVKYIDDNLSVEGLYLLMEYVPGENLHEVLNRKFSLDSETVVRISLQCCDVLDYLHTFDPPIIYRDLKPSNLMLRPDGLVVFVDFGIARDFDITDAQATRVVTSGYSPPEQYFGKPEPRGDLYSLGATMHHLLTGVRPRPLNTCRPLQLNPSVLPELDALVGRLTSQNKEDRPASAREVQKELFLIYKGLHPDFEIPELGVDEEMEQLEIERSEGNFEQAKKMAAPNEKISYLAWISTSQKLKRPTQRFGTEYGISALLTEKLRQWLSSFTGKRFK